MHHLDKLVYKMSLFTSPLISFSTVNVTPSIDPPTTNRPASVTPSPAEGNKWLVFLNYILLSSEGGMFLSGFSRWFLINTRWHKLTTMTSPPIVLITHYRMTSYFILVLPTGYELVWQVDQWCHALFLTHSRMTSYLSLVLQTGYELVWQVDQWCHALFLTYGSHGRYHRFDRFLKLFLDTWCHSL